MPDTLCAYPAALNVFHCEPSRPEENNRPGSLLRSDAAEFFAPNAKPLMEDHLRVLTAAESCIKPRLDIPLAMIQLPFRCLPAANLCLISLAESYRSP